MKNWLNRALAVVILLSLIPPLTTASATNTAGYNPFEIPYAGESVQRNNISTQSFIISDKALSADMPDYPQPPVSIKKEVNLPSPSHRQVTLITGDKVDVAIDAQGKVIGQAIALADPRKPGQSYSTIKLKEDLYVFPRGIDFNRFDWELFNISRLVRDDYDKEKGLPVMVSLKPLLPESNFQAFSTNLHTFSYSVKTFSSIRTLAVRLQTTSLPSSFKYLSTDIGIEKIWLDKKVRADLSQSVPQIEAPSLWSSGITGAGKIIAIVDTGIDASHPGLDDLDDNSLTSDPKVLRNVNFSDDPDYIDRHGHGTHVAGIAAGTAGIPTYPVPTSPSHAWWSGTGNNLNNTLTRSVDLAGFSSATLTFNTYYNLERNYDWGHVEVSRDGGITWTGLWSFTGNSASFIARSIDLSAYVGSAVLLRLRITSDYIIYYDGWFLDDIAVSGIFSDNVEAGSGSWVASGWSIIEAFPHSGQLAWFSGSGNGLTNSLQRFFNLSGLTYASLTFLTRYSMETNYDFGYVQVSTDDGRTWTDLASPPFTGNSGLGFVKKAYNLTPYAGLSNVLIRFLYQTNNSISWEGWYVDDISIPQLGFLDNVEAGNTGWTVINTGALSPAWKITNLYKIGVAPGAWLWNIKVLNRYGYAFQSWVIDGIRYASLGPDGLPRTDDEAHIINLSLGGVPTDGNDPVSLAVDQAIEDGLVVAAAAGNSGPYYYTIGSPAASRRAITVGAVDKNDSLASFSSRGPTLDFRVKPDILAPGVSISSTVPGGGYASYSGTSMAAPHVAGAAALLLQATTLGSPRPAGWNNNQYVKNALINSAKDLGLNVYQQGAGRISVASAAFIPLLFEEGNRSLGSLASPASINYTVHNRATASITINFTSELREMDTNIDWSTRVWFTPGSLTIPAGGAASTTMTVNASGLPGKFFSGKIKTTGSVEARAIFGFHSLNAVTLRKIPRDTDGSVEGDSYILFSDTPSFWQQKGNFDASGKSTFLLPSGIYNIFTEGLTGTSPKESVIIIKENQAINTSITINLDEANAAPITLNPNKAGQKLASLYSDIEYAGAYFDALFGSLSYYPESWTSYVSTITWKSWSDYSFYTSASYNAADPNLVNAPEWHRLLYSRNSITGPITYNVDYSRLAKRNTHYQVAHTSDVKAERYELIKDPIARINNTFTWYMTAPQSRVEWLSPSPAYYMNGKYSAPIVSSAYEPPRWWYETWQNLQYAPGDGLAATLSYSLGGHPLRPGYTNFNMGFDVSTGYWNLSGYIMADRDKNGFNSNVLDWISPIILNPALIEIYRDGLLDGYYQSGYTYNIFRFFMGRPWPQYKVRIKAEIPTNLSNIVETILTFRPDPAADSIPPELQITANWEGAPTPADERNRVPSGNISMRLNILDSSPLSTATPPWVKWSTNDGSTWNDAVLKALPTSSPLPSPSLKRASNQSTSSIKSSASGLAAYNYEVTLPGIAQGKYLSFWTKAVDNAGNALEYKGIRGLYVKSAIDNSPPPAPSPISPADNFTTGKTPTFMWTAVTDDTPPVLYDLQVANNSDMVSPSINKVDLSNNSYTLSYDEALSPGTWYWRVRARDGVLPPNYSAWSYPIWSFKIPQAFWTMTMGATMTLNEEPYRDYWNYGQASDALPGLDDYDIPKPPPPPDVAYMVLYSLIGGSKYWREVRPPLDPANISFRLHTAELSGSPILTWDITLVPPLYKFIVLQDTVSEATLNMRVSSSYTYSSALNENRNFNLYLKSNNPPAVQVMHPNGGMVAGTVNVTASAYDLDGASPYNDRIASVTFQYASPPYNTWHHIGTGTLTSGTPASGIWSASWNTFLVPEGSGYKVRAIASDTPGSMATDDSDSAFSIVHKISATTTWPAGWVMWSYPFQPDPITNSGQLGDDISSPYVFHYNALTGLYELTNIATPGWGYWTRVNATTSIDAEGFPILSPTFEIPLHAPGGWNQIGHPYNIPVNWDTVTLRKDGITKSLLEAQALGWVSEWLYNYNTAVGVYETKGAADGVLQPMKGYWFKSNQPGITLIITSP